MPRSILPTPTTGPTPPRQQRTPKRGPSGGSYPIQLVFRPRSTAARASMDGDGACHEMTKSKFPMFSPYTPPCAEDDVRAVLFRRSCFTLIACIHPSLHLSVYGKTRGLIWPFGMIEHARRGCGTERVFFVCDGDGRFRCSPTRGAPWFSRVSSACGGWGFPRAAKPSAPSVRHELAAAAPDRLTRRYTCSRAAMHERMSQRRSTGRSSA